MKIELRLKELLQEHKLDYYGIERDLSNECNLHRHTIGKLMRNQMTNPSLDVLGRVCQWLVMKGVPAEKLPGALFAIRAPELWKAIRSSPSIGIYLGMYQSIIDPESDQAIRGTPMSIARNDAAVASKIIDLLSHEVQKGDARPAVRTHYVLFRYSPSTERVRGPLFDEDKMGAKKIFKEMESQFPHESAILLGSQRVNYVLECLVANYFCCTPFKPVKERPEVPFYLSYRDFDRPVPSCFGGTENPPGYSGSRRPGIYYLDEKERWNLFEWRVNELDAGVVIIIRDADTIIVAVFGVSGRATYALGNELIKRAEKFWPEIPEKKPSVKEGEKEKPEVPESIHKVKGKEIGVYICRVKLSNNKAGQSSWALDVFEDDRVEVLPLDKKVLKRYAKKSRASK